MRKLCAALLVFFGLASAALAQMADIRTTSGSGAATSSHLGGSLIWTGTAPTTWAVTLPSNPTSGTRAYIATDTTLTTLVTVTAASGDTLVAAYASQTLTANATVAGWQFFGPSRTWYRIQ